MGLLDFFRRLLGAGKTLKIIVIGLDNAGKSTIVASLSDEDPSTVAPTTGFSVTTVRYSSCEFTVWDLGGQQYIRKYWPKYFKGVNGIVCQYSALFLILFMKDLCSRFI